MARQTGPPRKLKKQVSFSAEMAVETEADYSPPNSPKSPPRISALTAYSNGVVGPAANR